MTSYRVFIGRSCVYQSEDHAKAKAYSGNTKNTHGQDSSLIEVNSESEFKKAYNENVYGNDTRNSYFFNKIKKSN